MLIIGIDPGKSGGIAWVGDGWTEPLAVKMPETVHELAEHLRRVVEEDHGAKCYLERVASRPGQGVASMFKFGRGLGNIEGVLAALQIPFEWVTPQKWQKSLGCLSSGDKNVTKCRACELFPRTRWIHATADAALICEWGRRTEASRMIPAEVTP